MLAFVVHLGALFAAEECSTFSGRARLAYESRRYDTALVEFRRALTACGPQASVLLGLAQTELLLQQFPASISTLDQLLAAEPRNVDALKLKGDALYLSGDEAGSEGTLLKAIAIDPKHENARYALGRIYYQQTRYTDALKHFSSMAESHPASYRAHDHLGLCYEALNQDAPALRSYLRALDLVYKDHPGYDSAYANLASYFLRKEDPAKAFQLAVEASKRNPASARNAFLTGKALYKLDKLEQSVRWLKQSTELDPKYPEPRYLLGQLYRKQGNDAESEKELSIFRELSKNPRPRR